MPQKNKHIILKNISKTFVLGGEEIHALHDITISIASGEFASVIGPSGSGKSTLMHLIGLLDSPTDGQYILDGEDVSDLSDNQKAYLRNNKIGFVFQTFNLLPRYTAFKNIELPLIYQGKNKEYRQKRVAELIKLTGLSGRENHKPSELSGGQRQRVAIARALTNNPSIILADEPTGNLDSKTGNAIIELLEKLNTKEKVTVLVVSHDPEVAKRTNRIISLRDGKIHSDKKRKK